MKNQVEPGAAPARRAWILGLISIFVSPIPGAGMILGSMALKSAARSRAESDRLHRSRAAPGTVLGSIGFFANLMVIGAAVTVLFLQATNIVEIGALS